MTGDGRGDVPDPGRGGGPDRVQEIALGRAPADLVLSGGEALVPDGSVERRDVAVAGDHIAALPADATGVTGPDTTVVDASGTVAVPGFVDAHTHLDYMVTPGRSYHRSLAGGTTSVVSEVTGLGPAFGARGVEALLDATAGLPLSVFLAVPPQPVVDTFGQPAAGPAGRAALGDLLDRERVVGVGEVDWVHVVGRDRPLADAPLGDLFERARRAGGVVTGHGAGCRGANLDAFAAVVDDDHEAIAADEFRDRVRAGVHAVGRSGTIRDDVPALAEAHGDVPLFALSLATDGVWPRDLLDGGHMDAVVRRAVEAGVPPLDAVRMAGETTARHFGLADRGTLAPGKVADVVCLSDLESVAVETVVADGRVVVREGDPVVGPRPHEYPADLREPVPVTVDEGTVRVPTGAVPGDAVRAVEYGGGLLSRATTVEPPVRDGAFRADPPDLAKVTVADRHPDRSGAAFTGFITGLGLERGAVAATTTWEQAAVVVVGADDDAMCRAAGRVAAQGGGWVVVEDGEVCATHPCPVGACMADRPLGEVADALEAVESALCERGVAADQPLLAVATLTFFGVPALKLTPQGYADIPGRRVVGLDPD